MVSVYNFLEFYKNIYNFLVFHHSDPDPDPDPKCSFGPGSGFESETVAYSGSRLDPGLAFSDPGSDPEGSDPLTGLAATDDAGRPYYAAGVPGSFHRRLFPKRSVDVFYSAFSLHWLSLVPESVTNRRSPAYNKGRVFIHGATEATVCAYRRQFQADLASFLRCRALEVRRGGSMFLVCLGRTNQDNQGGAGLLFGTHFQDAWEDLVQEGLVDAEKRDGFNVPVYAPSLQEFREAVEADGSFAVNTLQVVRGGSPLVVSRPDDAAEVGRAMANSCRSVCGVLVEAHVGHEIGDALFARLERRAASHAEELMEQLQFFHIVASLTFRE